MTVALAQPVRTLLPVALAFQLGLMLAPAASLGPAGSWLALACLGVGCVTTASAMLGKGRPAPALGVPLTLAALACGWAVGPPAPGPSALPNSGPSRFTAKIESVQYGPDGDARSRVRVLEGSRLADGAPIGAGTALWARPFPLPEGATVRMLATVTPRAPFRNPSPHPALVSAHPTQGSATLPSADAFTVLHHDGPSRLLDRARRHVRERLTATLPKTTAAVARSLVLGDGNALSESDQVDVRASGMAHVFAVSGMHVTLLAGSLLAGLSGLLSLLPALAARFEVKRLAAGMGIPLALGIAAFTGDAPSGWRASITTAIAWSVTALGRKPDPIAVMAAAWVVLAAATPAEALRPAFLLSIAATAAIVTGSARRPESLSDVLRAALVLGARTSLATAPVVLWVFGSLPLLGVIANLLLVPLGSALLVAAALHALVSCVMPPVALLSAPALSLGSRAFLHGCSAFAAANPVFTWPPLDLAQGLVLCAATSALLLARRARAAGVVVAGACVCLLLLEARLRFAEKPHGELRVTFLDVGQGDAALVDLPDGSAMLVDAGGNPQGGADPGERVVVPMLRARRRDHLDLAVLSHPHPDHYGGLAAVLAAFPVAELWDSGQAEAEASLVSTSSAARSLLQTARARGVHLRTPPELCGAPRTFAGARVEVLWPCPRHDSAFDPNDNSLVVRVRHGRHAFLFSGDIEQHAEAALVKSGIDLRADVLKVPHHGSRTSSSAELIRAVAPRLAVISAGAVNRFGHPHPEVTARLRSLVPTVVDLGAHGGVVVRTDGETLMLEGHHVRTTLDDRSGHHKAPASDRAARSLETSAPSAIGVASKK